MAKIVVHNDTDPGIAIVLTETPPGTPGKSPGFSGKCTKCGWPMHLWFQGPAIEVARTHVDSHDAELIGGDTDALVQG